MSLSSAADTKAAPVQVTHQSIAGPSHTPPDFSHFAAEHFQIDNEDVVSHDPRLNTDGEALYRFLLAQSDLYPPWIRINLKGTHQETHTRFVNEQDAQGRQSTRTENYTETITDFDFCIDVHAVEGMKPIHWTVADDEPAYRGKPVREVENYLAPGKRRTTTSQENGAQDNWEETRSNAGLPPWVRQTDMLAGLEPTTLGSSSDPEAGVLMSSKSVREWADEYCASPKYLKEFVYRKVSLLSRRGPQAPTCSRFFLAGSSANSKQPCEAPSPVFLTMERSRSSSSRMHLPSTFDQTTDSRASYPTSGSNS